MTHTLGILDLSLSPRAPSCPICSPLLPASPRPFLRQRPMEATVLCRHVKTTPGRAPAALCQSLGSQLEPKDFLTWVQCQQGHFLQMSGHTRARIYSWLMSAIMGWLAFQEPGGYQEACQTLSLRDPQGRVWEQAVHGPFPSGMVRRGESNAKK